MNKEEVMNLASRLMFELNEDEVLDIMNDFEVLEKQIDLLNKIDTEGVEEMVFPYDVKTHYYRQDEADHVLDKEEALSNAYKVKEGHIVVPKVVK